MTPVTATVLRGAVPATFNGSGYGYGDGSGSGYGDGSGSGYGDGSGYGSGYGYGSGSGSGDGYGYGYGSGDGSYWQACLAYFIAKLPAAAKQRAEELVDQGIKLAYWRATTNGQPANHRRGRLSEPAAPGVVHKVAGPLEICTSRALHATLIPPKHSGERWWIVALHGAVVGDDDKMACLEREIIGECV